MATIRELDQIIEKYKMFWAGKEVHEPLLLVRNWILPPETIDRCEDAAFVLKTYEENYAVRRSVNDDYIPMLCSEFGPAFLSHVAGCEIYYGNGTSWSKPVLNDLSDNELEKIRFHEDRFDILAERIEYFKSHNKNNYVISSGDLESPFDLAVDLLGVEQFCLGFYDTPSQMHKFLNKCFDVWFRFVNELHRLLPKYDGGFFNLWNAWQPDGTLWTTIDASYNVSPDTFNEFFMPIIERILTKFEWIWVHVHSGALHVLEPLIREPRIKGFEIADDPNCKTKTIVSYLQGVHRQKNLMLDCKKEDLSLFAGEFDHSGLLLFVDGVQTPREANELLRKIKT